MAEEEIVTLQDNFYRDSFNRVLFLIVSVLVAIILLFILAAYIYFNKPVPITFPTAEEFRVQAPVPLDLPYHSLPEVYQWVADVFPSSFNFDFNHYRDQVKAISHHFTPEGYQSFLDQLKNFVNFNTLQTNKLFVNGVPDAAPFELNQGLLAGRYAWWIQIPVKINYAGLNPPASKTATFHILVVRISTLNNLMGLGIEKVLLAP